MQQQLAAPVDVFWSGNPLRSALRGLSQAQRVAVLIDRRADPGQKLDLQLDRVPLETAFREVAGNCHLGVSLLGPVVYFGPPEASRRLRTISALRLEEIRQLPAATGRTFLQPRRIAWNDFVTPRALLTQLAEENGLELIGLDQVPHDLWAAADLPPLSLIDRLTLIAVQFDLTFEVAPGGRGVRLVPVPDDVGLVRKYPGGRQPDETAEKFAALAPNARIKVVGSDIFVKGLVEDHQRLTSPPRPPQHAAGDPPVDIERIRIDKLSVQEVPVGQLLEQLAARLKLDLRIRRNAFQEANISLQQLVSVNVENATVDELFQEIAESAGLRYCRRGTVVEISPAE